MGIDTDDISGVYGNHQCVHKTLEFINCSTAAHHFHLKVPEEVRPASFSLHSLTPLPSSLPGLLRAYAPRQTASHMMARACRRAAAPLLVDAQCSGVKGRRAGKQASRREEKNVEEEERGEWRRAKAGEDYLDPLLKAERRRCDPPPSPP